MWMYHLKTSRIISKEPVFYSFITSYLPVIINFSHICLRVPIFFHNEAETLKMTSIELDIVRKQYLSRNGLIKIDDFLPLLVVKKP